MAKLLWDQVGQRLYETGLDQGVLYLADQSGAYNTGYVWNGLTTVTESPSGAESNPQYADNIKYVDIQSAEEFGATIEAFTYPEQFAQCDGTAVLYQGIGIGQQTRRPFGLAYRTLIGDDVVGTAKGYKIHLIYGCVASPSEKANTTINDSPEAINFSWEVSTTPVPVGDIDSVSYRPAASLVIDSTKYTTAQMKVLTDILYGTDGVDPRLPMPAEVVALFSGAVTAVDMRVSGNQPSYNAGSRVITLPAVTGVIWRVNGVIKTAGAQPALSVGQTGVVTATPGKGYRFSDGSIDRWSYTGA